MNQQQLHFLKTEFVPLLKQLQPLQKGKWGKMDAQQMVEHFRDVLKVANGKIQIPVVTPPEYLQKARDFIFSDKLFRENTKSPVLPEEPRAHKYKNIEEAISKMEVELNDVFSVYENEPGKILSNPVFGDFDYDQQIFFLHKHALHHLRQFGLVE